MTRPLGVAAMIIGAAFLIMGALVLLVPEPSVGLGIGFLVVGFAVASIGVRTAVTTRPADAERQPAPASRPARPRDDRPKSKFRQILDGLSFFN